MKRAALLLLLLIGIVIAFKTVSDNTYATEDTKRAYFQVQSQQGFLEIMPFVHHEFPNKVYSVSAPESVISRFKNNPLLIYQGDVSLWSLNQSKLEKLSCYPINSEIRSDYPSLNDESTIKVTVAVLDTGITKTHNDLKDNIVDCKNMQTSSLQEECDDKNGHGTHISGIISGDGFFKGIAQNSSIASLQVCSASGRCYGDDVVKAILYSVDKKYPIVNLGLGGDSIASVEEQFIKSAYDKGTFIVASAGNNGTDNPIEYPAVLKEVRSVGSIDNDDSLSSFSSGGLDVDFLTPGVSVESTYKDGCYATWTGTSVSSAVLSGLAAYYWQGDAEKTHTYLQNLLNAYDTDEVSVVL